jgi:hypothetical protein
VKTLALLGCWFSFTFTMPADPVVSGPGGAALPPLRVVGTLMDEFGVVADTIPLYAGPGLSYGPPRVVGVDSLETVWIFVNADSVGRRLRVGTVGHTGVWSDKSNAIDVAAGLSPFGATYWDYPFYDMVPSGWDRHVGSFAHSTYQAPDQSGIWCVKFRIGPAAELTQPIPSGKWIQTPPPHIRISGRP